MVQSIERRGPEEAKVTDSTSIAANIAAALRRERDRAGLSLTELARRAGIAKSTLSQLESGVGNPSVETLWSIGVALGVPFSRLVEPVTPGVSSPTRRTSPARCSPAAGTIPGGTST
jgi:DNA-binding XRE family transcriptional regulator